MFEFTKKTKVKNGKSFKFVEKNFSYTKEEVKKIFFSNLRRYRGELDNLQVCFVTANDIVGTSQKNKEINKSMVDYLWMNVCPLEGNMNGVDFKKECEIFDNN